MTDALSASTTNSQSVVCNATGTSDSACYVQTATIDSLGHQSTKLTDALEREIYDQRYTGNSPATYALYATTMYGYDAQGHVVQILQPDGTTFTSFLYDEAGHQIRMTDPDRGTLVMSYDADGNLIESIDARGSSGTIYIGYDGLNRPIWRSTQGDGSNPSVTYTYDSTANGNNGVGHVTGETFSNGTLSGSYSYVYDQRGQQISQTITVDGSIYQTQTTYDDAGNILTQTYPDGEVVTNSYAGPGWLSGLTTQISGTTVTLLSNGSYIGTGGAGHLLTGASLDSGVYQYAATYDLLQRLTDTKITLTNGGAELFEATRTYDGASNVISQTTTLPQGTDQQQFCYDE